MSAPTKARVLLAVLVLLNVLTFGAKQAAAYIPREPKPDLQRICYLGHIGQPSGCVWVRIP